MGLWDSIKERFGIGDEEYYDDEYDEEPEQEVDGYDPKVNYRSPYDTGETSSVRRLDRQPDVERARAASPRVSSGAAIPGPGVQAVPQVKMQIVEPRSFSEAQTIADKFRVGMPVIMNLTMTDPDLARRLIDFASGLTYGLNGGLQKVSEKVFMLTPANVDVSAEQRRVLRDRGLFDAGV
ncbi:MAG: cell division protein SepF [Coriobacteriales bacterium]|nr:cell division protein SepF [Actinomycetes bacterium]